MKQSHLKSKFTLLGSKGARVRVPGLMESTAPTSLALLEQANLQRWGT